jgi:hypothetical protein
MAYGMDSQGLIPGRGKIFSSTPQYPDWLCNPLHFHLHQGKVSLELRNHFSPWTEIRSCKISIIERERERECLKRLSSGYNAV